MLNLLWQYSYAGIFVGLVLCGIGLPIPEEVPIALAGVAASHGHLNAYFAYLACLFGAIGGDCLMYCVGRYFGRNVLREHPRLAGFLTPEREAQLEDYIKRHGVKALFLCRFMIGVRSAVYLTAGILRVPFWFFVMVDGICATVVVSSVFGLSYAFGDKVMAIIRRSETVFTVAVMTILTLLVCLYYYQKKRDAMQPVEPKQDKSGKVDAEHEANDQPAASDVSEYLATGANDLPGSGGQDNHGTEPLSPKDETLLAKAAPQRSVVTNGVYGHKPVSDGASTGPRVP